MVVTVLMENTAPQGLEKEHGLSFHIAWRGRSLLLDAGSSGRFVQNARELGVDPAGVELAVLSHGHYDHADGLRAFFACNDRAPVWVRPTAGEAYYAIKGGKPVFVGIHRELWRDFQGRFRFARGLTPLLPGAWLVPKTVSSPDFDSRETHLFRKRGEDDFVPDDFSHEQSLVLETREGLAVFNSCSHGGIVNIVRSVREQLPRRRIACVVGGFHMYSPGVNDLNCPPEYVQAVAGALKELGVERIYTGHCTGRRALELLRESFGEEARALTVGLRLELPDPE